MQSSSIQLAPSVADACTEEWKAHCPGLRPGKGHVLSCLLSKAGSHVDYSAGCVHTLDALQEHRLQDWRTGV